MFSTNKGTNKLDYSKYLLPVGSVIEKEVDIKIERNHVNYLLINRLPQNNTICSANNNELNTECDVNTKPNYLEQVTLMRYPSEKEILKLWIEESKINKSLSYKIMVLIDKLNLKT
jgi:hypothetical protein